MAKTTRFYQVLGFLFCTSLLLAAFHADARPHKRPNAPNPKYASITMDAQTGTILDEQNAYRALPPASLTKMMTLFMTFEAIEQGKLHLNKYLNVSANAVRQPPSKLGLKVGERITVKQAILALATRSANDVAYALGETIGGSEKRFTEMMNERARSLGMKTSYFANASGLPHPAQKSSAYDMAVLGRALMQYFPQHYHFFNTKFFTYKGQVITSHNRLMSRYPGMDGLKTGFTNASGFNLAASAVRNNRRVIVVVFGGRTAVSRDNHVADLMNRAFDRLDRGKQNIQVASATQATKQPVLPAPKAVANATPQAAPQAAATVSAQQVIARTAAATPSQRVVNANAAFAYPERGNGQVQPLRAPTHAANQIQPINPSNHAGGIQHASYIPNGSQAENWGIQVGAYSSPSLSQQAIQAVQQQLRGLLVRARPVVVPTATASGTVYRARIIGMTAENAAKACQVLSECMAFTVR